MQHMIGMRRKGATLFAAAFATVCSFAGIKYWDNPEFKAFDVGDYVQDGLVLNYDGIRNAGPTAPHNPSATKWVNCAKPGTYDMTRYSLVDGAWKSGATKGAWTDCGFVFSKDAVFNESAAFTIPTVLSHQILLDAKASDQNGIGYPVCGAADGTASSVTPQNWNYGASIGLRSTGGIPNTMYFTPMGAATGSRPTISGGTYTYGTAILNGNDAVMFDGIKAPWSAASTGGTTGHYKNTSYSPEERTCSIGICLGGHYKRTDEAFKGTIKSYRFYRKALSDDEVAWNRVVDEYRFFGRTAPLPVTNVVVATTLSGVDGDQPSGCYALDEDGYTFTAPTSRTVKGKRYALGGYTLEAWNGTGWDAPVPHEGSSYAATPSEKVRLTWQYSRPAGEGQLKTYDVSDYVTDGLQLFYDGILNQGIDKPHSYVANTWVNLGTDPDGVDRTLTLQHKITTGDPGSWDSDGFVFRGYSDFNKKGTSLANPSTHSIQALVDANVEDQIYGTCAYIYATAWDYSSLALRTAGDTPKVNSLYWCTGGNGAPNRPYTLNADKHYDYVTAIMDGSTKTLAFTDGVDIPSSGTLADGFYQSDSDLVSYTAQNIFLGGYNSSKDSLLVGKIKCFRYYPNKVLTPAEVLQNRKVDEYRYFGRYVVTNILVQSTYSYLDGYEKAGPYEVEGSYTFTAPESVTIKVNDKKITYACDGYTVETQDGIGWAALTSGTGNSYLYNTSAGTVRLTWKWKPVEGVRTANDYSFEDISPAGLALHYDGLLNQGVGVARSTTSTKWINLGSRPGMDLTRATAGSDTSKHGHWGDNGYVFTGLAQFNSAAGLQWATTFSAQTLVDAKHSDNTHKDGNYIAATTWKMFGMQIYGANSVGRFNVQGTSDIDKCPHFETATGIDYMTAIHDAATQTAVAFPGTKVPTEGSASDGYMHFDTFNGIENNQFRLGGWGGGPNSQNLKGTVKTFRYYDRVLTEEELIRNRNVDAVRYFHALGVTNVVEVIGTEETAYKVEGSWKFEAPPTVDDKTVTGYRLEVLEENGDWVRKPFRHGTSFTYSEDDEEIGGKKIKLEWAPEPPGMMIIVK